MIATSENGSARARAWLPLAIWITSTIVAVLLAYGSILTRMAVLDAETRAQAKAVEATTRAQDNALQMQIDVQSRGMVRIEEKLDRLIELQMRR